MQIGVTTRAGKRSVYLVLLLWAKDSASDTYSAGVMTTTAPTDDDRCSTTIVQQQRLRGDRVAEG